MSNSTSVQNLVRSDQSKPLAIGTYRVGRGHHNVLSAQVRQPAPNPGSRAGPSDTDYPVCATGASVGLKELHRHAPPMCSTVTADHPGACNGLGVSAFLQRATSSTFRTESPTGQTR